MIDPRILRDDPDRVRAAQAKRGLSADVVDRALSADERPPRGDRRRSRPTGRAEAAGQAGRAGPGRREAGAARPHQGRSPPRSRRLEAAQAEAEEEWRDGARWSIPNLAADEAPAGGEDDFVVLEHVGTPREFDFEPRDHVELGRMLGAIDLERGAKVCGLALLLPHRRRRAARARAGQHGDGPGPRGRLHAGHRRRRWSSRGRWRAPASSARPPTTSTGSRARTSTSSAPRRCRWRRTTPTRSSTPQPLPLRYAAFSPCFRKEAGSHGKDTRGIIRVHWFDKVEMFVYTTLEESYAEHQRLLEWEKEFLDKLELAYRVIDVAAGDLGLSAQRKFDCEAWIPTQGQLPRAHLDLATAPTSRPAGSTSAAGSPTARPAGRHPQRHADRDHPHDRRDPRDPPAGRRLGAGARGAAALPRRPRGPEARCCVTLGSPGSSPSTSTAPCSKWVEGAGTTYEQIPRGDVRRRPPGATTPAPTSCSPAAARRTA